MPAIVASSTGHFFWQGATDVTVSGDHAGLRSRCSAKSALPASRSFPGARRFLIGPNSFVRHAPSGVASYANYRVDRSDEPQGCLLQGVGHVVKFDFRRR
jgi:hypothetical protein